jgi:hypothetical protein
MDSKYTTITIPKELSYRLRKLALDKGMKTSKVLELLIDQMESKEAQKLYELNVKKWEELKAEAVEDLEEFKEKKKK